jgi:hypothetical protein
VGRDEVVAQDDVTCACVLREGFPERVAVSQQSEPGRSGGA